jgi:hypothetical protein
MLLFAGAILLLSVGLSGYPIADTLRWVGALLSTMAVVAEWLSEDFGLVPNKAPLNPRLKKVLRLSTPAFWVFPLLVIYLNAPTSAFVALAVIVGANILVRVVISRDPRSH